MSDISIITKLTDCDTMKTWLTTINKLIDEVTMNQKVWTATVTLNSYKTKAYTDYQFSEIFPSTGMYDVFYGGILLSTSDYELKNDTLHFISEPKVSEAGLPIRIYYRGNKTKTEIPGTPVTEESE